MSAPAPSGLSLRPVRGEDEAFLLRLYAGTRADEMAAASWPEAAKSAFLADQFHLQQAHYTAHFPQQDFWIVERLRPPLRPQPVGRLYVDRSAPLWRVVDISLLPERRGQGTGAALLQWLQGQAGEAGAHGIDLHVMADNPRAQALYRRLGFQVVGEAANHRLYMTWSAPGFQAPR